jgi:hypothetical protein
MKELFESENLIELHDKLNEFAVYHQNKGGQKAHKLIKSKLDELNSTEYEHTNESILIDRGYKMAYKEILELLHLNFVP